MAIMPITLYGDKILKKKTIKVTKIDKKTLTFIKDMFDTMYNADGMGLAANQVGSDKSIFIIDISQLKGHESSKPMVFINPKITSKSGEKTFSDEGCLSLPSLRGNIERPKGIKLIYQDLKLNEQVLEDDDLLARVIQHENDHLNGVLFIDRMKIDMMKEDEQVQIRETLIKIKNRTLEFEYPVTKKEVKS